MAILKFRIYWEEDESVYRVIAIKHQQTFFDLHLSILKSYEFDTKHHATFYKSNDAWLQGREITLEKYEKEYKAEPLIMADVNIGSQIADPNQKFVYAYDFVKNWRFMVELINVDKEENKNTQYPECIRIEGLGPSQYGTKGLIDTRLAEIEEKYDLQPNELIDGFSEEGEEDEASDTENDDSTQDVNEEF